MRPFLVIFISQVFLYFLRFALFIIALLSVVLFYQFLCSGSWFSLSINSPVFISISVPFIFLHFIPLHVFLFSFLFCIQNFCISHPLLTRIPYSRNFYCFFRIFSGPSLTLCPHSSPSVYIPLHIHFVLLILWKSIVFIHIFLFLVYQLNAC